MNPTTCLFCSVEDAEWVLVTKSLPPHPICTICAFLVLAARDGAIVTSETAEGLETVLAAEEFLLAQDSER